MVQTTAALINDTYRGYVQGLVSGISRNSYLSFKTEAAAVEYYEKLKKLGCVEVKRNPGDSVRKFGPIDSAMA